jgi:predicted transposase YbfD/YdcC
MVQATREEKGKISVSRRYYISSLEPDSRLLAYGIRKHWAIESMHWVLDVVFSEDYSRTRTKNGQANMKTLRRWALNILKANKKKKVSTKKKRWKTAMDVNYLEELLFQSNVLPS